MTPPCAGKHPTQPYLENDATPDNQWVWAFTDNVNSAFSRIGDGGGWSGTFTGNAFTLYVPAPGALALLGLGMVSARRRRR